MSNGNQNWELVEKHTYPRDTHLHDDDGQFSESITERMKVPAVWIVRTAVLSTRSAPARDYFVAVTFIPDQSHA